MYLKYSLNNKLRFLKKIFQTRYIKPKQTLIILGLLSLLVISFVLGITFGSYNIPLSNILKSTIEPIHKTILIQIRAPRVVLAGFVGASLALSGASLQGLFRNPLADPGLIGVSAGAALGATSIIVLSNHFVPETLAGPFLLPLAAIGGAFGVIILLFLLTKGFKTRGTTYMLLIGIAINSLAGVCIGILTYISSDAELRSLTFWTMGSFGGVTWPLLLPAIIIISFFLFWAMPSSRNLDLLQLGEIEAQRLGINLKKLRFNIVISSAAIVGISVSLSGMIGFIGLVVPHLARLLGGVNHSYLMISSAIAGSSLMIIADLFARLLVQPAELPVGLITSAIGAPFFLYLIINTKKA